MATRKRKMARGGDRRHEQDRAFREIRGSQTRLRVIAAATILSLLTSTTTMYGRFTPPIYAAIILSFVSMMGVIFGPTESMERFVIVGLIFMFLAVIFHSFINGVQFLVCFTLCVYIIELLDAFRVCVRISMLLGFILIIICTRYRLTGIY